MRPTPLHEVQDEAKVARLAESMATNGWTGEPILVVDLGNEWQAITGVHRLAAAEQAEVEVPIYLINDEDADLEALFDACRDDDRLDVLIEGGDAEAIRIMQAEVYSWDWEQA